MREILYRGKRKSGSAELNGKWVYGYYAVAGDGTHVIIENGMTKPVAPETAGEWTGLLDKNGAKIFEGDIVRLNYGVCYETKCYPSYARGTEIIKICEVVWNIDEARFEPSYWVSDINFEIKLEVIGNITDNPELLEAAE